MKDLIFNLKHKWFKEFEDGLKEFEFREMKPYWAKRFCENYKKNSSDCKQALCYKCLSYMFKRYESIILKDGYPSNDQKEKILTRKYIGVFIFKVRQNDRAEKEMIGKYCFAIPCMGK